MKKLTVIALFFLLVILAAGGREAAGSGYAVYSQGQDSMAQGTALVAHTNSPSAIFYNPALINSLSGTQAEANLTILDPSRKFTSSVTGRSFSSQDNLIYVPSGFMSYKFNDKLSAGIGFFTPFGLVSNWGETWEGRYITTKASLLTIDVNPVLSYKVLDNLSVAAGPDFVYADANLQKMLNLSGFRLPDARQTLKGDAVGFGWNAGVAWDPHADWTVGGSYRSAVVLRIDGTLSNDLPAGTPGVIASLLPNTGAHTKNTLPAQAAIAVAYKGIPHLVIELGGRWEEWSKYNELRVDLDSPVAGATVSITPKNWKDIFAFDAGAKYQISDAFAIMAGYILQGNPIPDATFEPSVPDSGSSVYTAGVEYKTGKFRTSIAYGYQHFPQRTKNNAIDDNVADGILNPATSANGVYSSHIHLIGFTVAYSF